jgi:ADP-ribose pyrophosphatase
MPQVQKKNEKDTKKSTKTTKKSTQSVEKVSKSTPKVSIPEGKKDRSKKLAVAKELPDRSGEKATVLSSKLSYQGPLFKVFTEQVREPSGTESRRDVIRHNGSIVILAVDASKDKKDPRIIMEQQYRHAAGQYLVELPAGKLEPGEDPLEGAKRELKEETGYEAKKWTKLVRYFASPGFLGEWMQVFLAEELTVGDATPEEDESIDVAAIPLSKILKMIAKGKVLDGKTLVSVMTYDRLRKGK